MLPNHFNVCNALTLLLFNKNEIIRQEVEGECGSDKWCKCAVSLSYSFIVNKRSILYQSADNIVH